jgi:TPR repeat protein
VLGTLHEEGQGVEQNTTLAGLYYRKACNMENLDGCNNLRLLYPEGDCPCFNSAEIMLVCPRPDSDATQIYEGQNGNRKLNCFSTRNYSPGSIMFDVYAANNDGNPAGCFVQSVQLEHFGSGGQGAPLSSESFAACSLILDEAANRLNLSILTN